MKGYTDLASELYRPRWGKSRDGARVTQSWEGCIQVTRTVLPEAGGGGKYITLEDPALLCSLPRSQRDQLSRILCRELAALLPPQGPVLLAGVGSSTVTADSLGPMTLNRVMATGHLGGRVNQLDLRPVYLFSSGTTAATGLHIQQTTRLLARELRAECVVCVDSLCAASAQRLGRTVQLTDTALSPGGERSYTLSRKTLEVPVVCIGIPTVMEAPPLRGKDKGAAMVVCLKEVDSLVAHGARLLASGLGRALYPGLTEEELDFLAGGC